MTTASYFGPDRYCRLTRIVTPLMFAVSAGGVCATEPSPSGATVLAPNALVPSLSATIAAMPKNIARAPAPGLEAAIGAAQAAVRACKASGATISVLVADIDGKPIVLLSGDGAGYRSQLIAQSKANIVARYKLASIMVATRARSDKVVEAEAAADPGIGVLRGGGLPVLRDGAMIGIVAVSGASLVGGDLTLDEQCARVAVTRLEKNEDGK